MLAGLGLGTAAVTYPEFFCITQLVSSGGGGSGGWVTRPIGDGPQRPGRNELSSRFQLKERDNFTLKSVPVYYQPECYFR